MSVTRTGALPLGAEAAYDVVVVGAGVVGSAIARTLARHPLRIALVEASNDVGDGTSKANTAILHTGFDAVPGTLEARLVREGHRLLSAYAQETGIPAEPLGALLVAWDEGQRATLPASRRRPSATATARPGCSPPPNSAPGNRTWGRVVSPRSRCRARR